MTPEIEALYLQIAERVRNTLREIPAPDGMVYACGFWLFYCDYTMVGVPCFAYNVVGNEQDAKWSPPEWLVAVEDRLTEAIQPLYERVTELMQGQDHAAWDELIHFQWHVFAELCLQITREARTLSHWQLSDDFVCGIFEDREGEDTYAALVQASIGQHRATQLGILSTR